MSGASGRWTHAGSVFAITLGTGIAWFLIEWIALGLSDGTIERVELVRRMLHFLPWQIALFAGLAVPLAIAAMVLRFGAWTAVWSALALATFFFLSARICEGLLRREGALAAAFGFVAVGVAVGGLVWLLAAAQRAVPSRFARAFGVGAWLCWTTFVILYLQRSGAAIGMWQTGPMVLVDSLYVTDAAAAIAVGVLGFALGGRALPIAGVTALALAASLLYSARPEPVEPGQRNASLPDVVVFLVDTFRQDHLGARFDGGTLTPHLDALAAESVRFTSGYSPGNLTRIAMPGVHASLPYRVTQRTIPEGVTTLAEHMKELGYRTVGISTNPNVSASFGYGQGFDVFIDSRVHRDFLVVNVLQILGARLPGPSYAAGIVTSALYYPPISDLRRDALRLLDQYEGPTFLYVHTMDAHGPYLPPRRYLEKGYRPSDFYSYYKFNHLSEKGVLARKEFQPHLRNVMQRYRGEVRFTDEELGDLMDDLKSRGRWSESLVWFLSDHGEAFGEHDFAGHGKLNMSDTLIRVPFLLKPPESSGIAPHDVRLPVSTLDLLPTTLALLGARVPDDVFGRDVSDVVRHGRSEGDRAVVSYTLLQGYELYAVMRGRWKLVVRMPKDGEISGVWLYDLESDPEESVDVAAENPEVVEGLMGEYRSWRNREAQAAFGGAETEVDPAMQEQLRRLGYVE